MSSPHVDKERSRSPHFLHREAPLVIPERNLSRGKPDDLSPKPPLDASGECARCGVHACRCHLLQYMYPASWYNHLPAPSLLSTVDPSYRVKAGADSWRALYQSVGYGTPGTAQIPGYHPYSDPNLEAATSRRKNATRESTSTLKAWLREHLKNPYPTKGEKIMLAIITKMTLTQVSTWFANARRRLKKENKMTWSARHRSGEDSDVEEEDWEESKFRFERREENGEDKIVEIEVVDEKLTPPLPSNGTADGPRDEMPQKLVQIGKDDKNAAARNSPKIEPATKPKIWSLVDTATSVSPKPRPSTHNHSPYVSIFPTYLSYLLPAYHSFLGPYYKTPNPDMDG